MPFVSDHPVRRRGRWLSLVLALLTGTVVAAPAGARAATVLSAGSGEYWQHIGYSFSPCVPIQWRPNLSDARSPAIMRDLIREAVAQWNTALGAQVMSVGPDTTASYQSRFDGTNTLAVETGNTGFGGVGGPSTVTRGGEDTITEADVAIFDSDAFPLDDQAKAILRLTIAHEIGHAIGFLHTIDPKSPMSYVAPDGTAIDAQTAKVARHLLTGPCTERREVSNNLDLFDSFARSKKIGFGHVGRQIQPLLHDAATNVVAAGVTLADIRRSQGDPVTRAVICRSDQFPDCLAGSSLAGRTGIVLFVPGGPSGRLPASVRDALARAFGAARAAADVIVVGGTSAVSAGVENDLRAEGYPVRRLRGVAPDANRYGTARAIADDVAARATGRIDTVYLARGDNPADAMTAGVIAARDGVPLVLTTPTRLPDVTRRALDTWRPRRVVLLGGVAAINQTVAQQVAAYADVVQRAQGRERTATSVAIARDLGGYVAIDQDPRPITLLNGRHPEAWALAIGYAPLGAVENSPILLVEADGFLPETPAEKGFAPGSGTFLAQLDLSGSHDGMARARGGDILFRSLGTSTNVFTPAVSMTYADQVLLYCRWYQDDCAQQGLG